MFTVIYIRRTRQNGIIPGFSSKEEAIRTARNGMLLNGSDSFAVYEDGVAKAVFVFEPAKNP